MQVGVRRWKAVVHPIAYGVEVLDRGYSRPQRAGSVSNGTDAMREGVVVDALWKTRIMEGP